MVNTARMWKGLTVVLALLVAVSFGRVAAAQTVDTEVGSTDVKISQGLLSALDNLSIVVEPTGAASLDEVPDDTGATSTVASFPVETGAVNTDPAATALDLLHAGGLQLSRGDASVELSDDASVALNDDVVSVELSDYVYNTNAGVLSGRAVSRSGDGVVTAFTRAPLFDLDVSGITVEAPATTGIGILRVTNVVLTLTQEGADFLNSTFGDTGLALGTPIGTADVAVVVAP